MLGDTAVSAGAQVPGLATDTFYNNAESGTVFSGVRFAADGNIYRRAGESEWYVVGSWLMVGANTAYHIHRTVVAGTLVDDGLDDQVLSSNRDYSIEVTTVDINVAIIEFRISNVGDTVTYDSGQYQLSAIRT